MIFFYAAGAMGWDGNGYIWHRLFSFPRFRAVSKTVTLSGRRGMPWLVVPLGKSVWNRVGLHNPGLRYWLRHFHQPDLTISIAGLDHEIEEMVAILEEYPLAGIELNYSCPNVKSFRNRLIPRSRHLIYLKLAHDMDPHMFELDRVAGIRLNSLRRFWGGLSGRLAQKENWAFIRRFPDLNVAGCSFTNSDDLRALVDMGCKEIAVGSVILTDPWLVSKLRECP